MTKVFIVRPFGKKRPVIKKNKDDSLEIVYFDFDTVESDLIRPAMEQLNLQGGTTQEVFAAGDIREDMFSELLLADIIIADVTIYNANVFYELGIRHALRDKRTVLIKCSGYDETPFDIIGYRYTSYEKDNPARALNELVKSLDETLKGDRKDSPVFNVLPQLETQDPEKYLAVPPDFTEEVKIAKETESIGKLALLSYEAESFNWKIPALRLIGKALFKMKANETARLVWEKIRSSKPDDLSSNEMLGTIYQRLAEAAMKLHPEEGAELFAKSDIAIEKFINNKTLSPEQLAEAYALKGRNFKTRWVNSWNELTSDECFQSAMQSTFLENAFQNYEKGFYENLNHFYSGINALGLLLTIISLAEFKPEMWELAFDTKEDADQKLKEFKNKTQKLSAAVQVSIEAAKNKMDVKDENYLWLIITEADFICLTSNKPDRVSNNYIKVLRDAKAFHVDAVTRQLKIYEALEVKKDNIQAALKAIPHLTIQQTKPLHYILFTGHMIDKPDRPEPRFPASKELMVRQKIKEKVSEEKNRLGEETQLIGIAGGACGGDILFHEICDELQIKSQMFLALPRDQFIVESVAFADADWIERFDKLYRKLPHPVLSENKELPKWLQKKSDYNLWTRNNLWLLESALVYGGMSMTLIALWDGKGGDGAGGSEHMVMEAKSKGAKTIILDINKI